MKTLKLNHNSAQLIEQGSQTSTWRLFDDKDIMVNDQIELVDKVDPKDPRTWRAIGIATVNQIKAKRLGDITLDDFDDQDAYETPQELIKTFKSYYGINVELGMPVKMIHFSFVSYPTATKLSASANAPDLRLDELKLYTDGGSRGNPGPSASGFAILDMDDNVVKKDGVYLGTTTNNQAEYHALKIGLEEAKRMQAKTVHVFMDSMLVVNQMKGIFKVKNRDLLPVHLAIKSIAGTFPSIDYTHVPRELNKLADR
ncbi:MAG: Ribonuclease, partial [Candidatus Saccharibacteria bacterium]|nr:Ribonuclease [Candidatus Saccharibacteria bacterium]